MWSTHHKWAARACGVALALCCASAGLAGNAHRAPRHPAWSAPINIGAPINTAFRESGARLSADGRSLYFSSDRPCGAEDAVPDFNLWVSRRAHRYAAWPEPRCLSINANPRVVGEAAILYQEREPELSGDQHWLYFVSDRPGSLGPSISLGGGDIWASWRHDIRDDDAWTEPFLVEGLNTEAAERTPNYLPGGGHRGLPRLVFSTTRAGGPPDLWMVHVLGGSLIGTPRPIPELNVPELIDGGGAMNRDGRELFLFRGANGPGLDIYTATRSHVRAPWSTPVPVDEVNSPVADQEVTLSPDGRWLFVSSSRAGSVPGADGVTPSLDIWVARRSASRWCDGDDPGGR